MSPYDREFEEICKARDEVYKSTKSYYEKHYFSKSKVIAMLTDLQLEIEEMAHYKTNDDLTFVVDLKVLNDLIEQKIDKLKEEEDG